MAPENTKFPLLCMEETLDSSTRYLTLKCTTDWTLVVINVSIRWADWLSGDWDNITVLIMSWELRKSSSKICGKIRKFAAKFKHLSAKNFCSLRIQIEDSIWHAFAWNTPTPYNENFKLKNIKKWTRYNSFCTATFFQSTVGSCCTPWWLCQQLAILFLHQDKRELVSTPNLYLEIL